MKKIIACLVLLSLVLSGCGTFAPEYDGTLVSLSDSKITVDGKEITADSNQAVYSAKDIVFYPDGKDFTYGEGTEKDCHTQEQADAHTVIHISKPGTYVLSGKLSQGQVAVDLGEDASDNPEAAVTLIFNGVDISCQVAPAVIFYNVYECCSNDEETATKDVDTSKAGANVVIADGTENNINGSYVAKIYKSYELSEDGTQVIDSKKLHKYDGAFYSKMTMNINGGETGDGVLNIKAENEGLDSELHLTVNGGIINITSGNDGINTNEDNVSVTTVNGGTLNILCDGSSGEGDGIDSNGWLVINSGKVTAQACSTSGDAGIDSDKGIYINGGSVLASGNMLDRIAGGEQTYAVFSFADRQEAGSTYTLKNAEGNPVGMYSLENSFTTLIVAGDELIPGDYTFYSGDTQLAAGQMTNMQGGKPQGERPEIPEGMERPEIPTGEQNGQFVPPEMPEGMDKPQMPDGEQPPKPDGEHHEMPEGMTPPDGDGKAPEGNMMSGITASTTFTLKAGENYFANVSPSSLRTD